AADEPVEFVNLRVTAHLDEERSKPARMIAGQDGRQRRERTAYFGPEYGAVATPVIDRNDLSATARSGPFVIEEYDSTTVVPPDATARLDEWSNIVIEFAGSRAG